MKKQKLVILTGPTAVGKTALSIALAKTLKGEIISADSCQVYKHMNIGSSKISPEEMQGVPHYLIDLLEPGEVFNVTIFQKYAKKYMQEIYGRGHLPILVGGTGFYIQSVIKEIDFSEGEENTEYRKKLEALAEKEGAACLHQMLSRVDPVSAGMIHQNNVKRVIRALEFHWFTGEPISAHNALQKQKESPYEFYYFVLTEDRADLYKRIDQRVDEMMHRGLLQEVKVLRDMGYDSSFVSMQALGYQELLLHLEGKISLEDAIYRIKRDTRHFAKRQLTWFKREKDVIWIDKKAFGYDTKRILDFMSEQVLKGTAYVKEHV